MNNSDLPIENVADVILGRDRRFPRAEAMSRLVASGRPDRELLLAQVLENTYEPRRYRAMAAIELGRMATSEAGRILIRNLPRTTDDVFEHVVRSLGRIGSEAALEAIDRLELPPNHPGSNAANFAAALIAHRHGLPGHELPFPAQEEMLERPAGETRRIEFGPALDGLGPHPYGIDVDSATLTRIRCGGQTHVVCLNREFLGRATEQLLKRKAIPALVAVRSPETGEYSIAYVVLSRPIDPAAIGLTLHRSSGRLRMAGTARIADGGIEFDLRAVRRPGGRALSLKGAMKDGRFHISEALVSLTPEMRLVPARRMRHIG